jgi:ArsR family transcriptional regulator, arsenate/arsenite/antimonite-responsive transcriptional repressor
MFQMRDLISIHAALADENRLRLLNLIKDGEICVCYLQGVLQTNQPRISRHLAYLRKSGLVHARRNGKWMHYRLKPLGGKKQKLLLDTLTCLADESQIKKDNERLKQIHCCPASYGIPSQNGEE